MNVTVFEAINITKKYRNTLALNQVSMSVMQGDIYGFIGENGAGKTTMIRLLTGLAEPTTGKIALFGESNKKLAKQRERIGCIIESPSLYLDMTAYENLEVQRLQRGIPGKGCIDNALAFVFFRFGINTSRYSPCFDGSFRQYGTEITLSSIGKRASKKLFFQHIFSPSNRYKCQSYFTNLD